MIAAVLCIGTELTRGELTNTNAAWLSERLTLLGYDVCEQVSVPDERGAIQSAIRRLASANRVIVATGGLGPTTDDITSDAAARAAGVELERHEPSLEAIRRRFVALGREMSPNNAKQADVPHGSDVLANAVGTAPGFAFSVGGCRCYFLPGVPAEMMRMFGDHVESELGRSVERTSCQLRLRTFGLPESTVGTRLAGVEEAFDGLTIGYRASFPEIEVKLLVRAGSASIAEERAVAAAREVRARLGEVVYGDDDDTYAAYVGRVLRDRGLKVALAESCTGGRVAAMITDVPGSSDYLLLSAVTYSNASKTELLGVSGEIMRAYGAVSAECAVAMADGARRVCDADIALAVTGIAGPGGGTETKPVGTVWIALSRRDGATDVERHNLPFGDRFRIRKLAAYLALRMLVRGANGNG